MKNTLSLSDLWLSFALYVQRVVGDVVIHVQTTELSKRKTVIEMACPPAHVIKQVSHLTLPANAKCPLLRLNHLSSEKE